MQPVLTSKKAEQLTASDAMRPVHGSVHVDVPVAELWRCFQEAALWPTWNDCFFWVWNQHLQLGDRLVWAFEPIRPEYLYKMPAVATIIELEPRRRVSWEVTALPGFYAQHTYYMEDLGGGQTRFGSWEKAMGPGFDLLRSFWLAHFTFVKDRSLAGARRLERLYLREGRLSRTHLERGLPTSA